MILNPKHASRFGVLDGLEKSFGSVFPRHQTNCRGKERFYEAKTLENLNESEDFSFFLKEVLFLGFFKGTFLQNISLFVRLENYIRI